MRFCKNILLHICREVTIIHLDIPSIIIDKDSEEGRAQIEREQSKSKKMAKNVRFSDAKIC